MKSSDMKDDLNTQSSYNRVAKQYAETYLNEFEHKLLDRELLDKFASRVKGKGRACDLGCGPGQVARYLHDPYPGVEYQGRRGYIVVVSSQLSAIN